MQDLKTGHLLGAAPKAQFWGQLIGATAGAVLSAFVYRVYTRYVLSLGRPDHVYMLTDFIQVFTKYPAIYSRCPQHTFGSLPPDS